MSKETIRNSTKPIEVLPLDIAKEPSLRNLKRSCRKIGLSLGVLYEFCRSYDETLIGFVEFFILSSDISRHLEAF